MCWLTQSFFLLSSFNCSLSVDSAILTPSVNSTFSQHPCPWTLVGEEFTNPFGALSLEQVLSSWRSLGCKQEVSVLLATLCLGVKNCRVHLETRERMIEQK